MPPKKKTPVTNEVVVLTQPISTSLESFLFKIRDICRNKGAQMDENGNIYADLIYDDLLFLKEVWNLAETGDLDIDVPSILEGTSIDNIKLNTIASLAKGDASHVSSVFNRLWTQLQRSSLKSIFEREFALKTILKDDKLKNNYNSLLVALLEYTGSVNLTGHEDTDPYEYFSKELKKGKSKYYGQFYTPEVVIASCINEIQPKFGEIGADVAAGTGKFMRAASKFISTAQPAHSAWDAYQYMRMVEIESKIYRQGILGSFINFKKIPNMTNQRKGNSFDLLIKEAEQFDYILANPPYGGTVDGFDELYYDIVKEQKGKRLVDKKIVKPDVVYPFEVVKKDTCVLFLQLCVNKLKEGGRAAIIFNATLMNDQHRDVLKWFLKKCNLYKMIVNPSGSFQCTGIETYSFIFTKGTPTENIEYYELGTNKKLGELTMAQIEERGWDIKPHFHAIDIKKYGVNLSPMKDLFTIQKGVAKASEVESGEYPFMTSAENKTTNKYTCEGEGVYLNIIPTGQTQQYTSKIRYYEGKCDMSSLMMRIIPKESSSISLKYIYYFLKLNIEDFKKVYNVEMYLRIDWNKFWDYQIPLPPLPIQQEIVSVLDRIFADPQDMKDCLAFTDKAMDLMLKDPTGKQLEDVMGGLRIKRAHQINATSVKAQMAAVVRSVGARGFERKKLGDVFNVKGGKAINKENLTGTKYPYYGCNGVNGYIDEYLFDGEYIICAQDGSIGSVYRVNEKFYPSNHTHILQTKDVNQMTNSFGTYYLKMCVDWKPLITSIIPKVTQGKLLEINIVVPPLPIQHEVLAILNEMEAELATLEQMAAKAEQRAKYILDGYLTPAPAAAVSE
jgi:type I restriction-modification system DNA methylase subunit/restriction endonuclease S subunit